jgi:hypothetical protein
MKSNSVSVLCMSEAPKSRSTVRQRYLAWRKEQGVPTRCDNPCCQFFAAELRWNDLPLPLILDHKSGNARDNTPENLRLLCPNCDSQNTSTRGGANAGRVEVLSGGSYHVRNRDGTQDAFVNGATLGVQARLEAGQVTASVSHEERHTEARASDA